MAARLSEGRGLQTVAEAAGQSPVHGAGARRAVSWREIERALMARIGRGVYRAGARLPTCETFAREFGANKNTVSRAYRALAERGYLETRPGRGTFVTRSPGESGPARAQGEITNLLGLAAQEAKLAGLPAGEFQALMERVFREAYAPSRPRIGFVECNTLDAALLSRDLQAALRQPVEPLLIADVAADPLRHATSFDVLAVNLTHLAEIEDHLGRAALASDGARARVVGLHVPVDSDSLTRVARLRPGTRLGIVCDLPQTLVALKGLTAGCNPTAVVSGCLSTRRARLRRLVEESDVLMVTPSASGRVRAQNPGVPIISIAFRADARSVAKLAEILAELARGPGSPADPPPG